MSDIRLIERWLPITEIGIEARERTPMTPFPAPNRLHVWWARRPLVASRAAILASLLPGDADHDKFKHLLGIHGDPVKGKLDIEQRRTGIRVEDPYGYSRAFAYLPDESDRAWLASIGGRVTNACVLDPTAGGGSIPLEAVRLGLPTFANDLNPVAALLLHATVRWPMELGMPVKTKFLEIANIWRKRVGQQLAAFYPQHRAAEEITHTYLWARTIRCPYCDGLIPLSPNWRLAPDGTGVRSCHDWKKMLPNAAVISRLFAQSLNNLPAQSQMATDCPFSNCACVIDGDEVKRQAGFANGRAALYSCL